MKTGILTSVIILTLWYAVCGKGACGPVRAQGPELRVQGVEQLIYLGSRLGELASPGADSRLPISDSEEEIFAIGATGVADTIVAVDPDKVRLEASLDPSVIIIDVRMKMEYRRGHIEKAVHLPNKKSLLEFAARTAVSRPLYLYCTTETRSRQAAKLLVNAGFERVFIIEGGFNKWKAYGLPVEKR